MADYGLADFIDDCDAAALRAVTPADAVVAIMPLMERLLGGARDFLKPEHYREESAHYARNAIHVDKRGGLSLYALVWLPGQWTPVHDHGSWGVVGVVEGALEEHNYMSLDGEIRGDRGIRLKRGGAILLGAGSITSFVPNPDHIHMTGVSKARQRTVSLHLYGRNMSAFHIYDVESGTRKMIDVAHNES